ncbi:MAG: putative lyase [Promethearchaeota archaeon]|nr:MAG: putative lyase [Candidatus Lokiarchaeota archaeon]
MSFSDEQLFQKFSKMEHDKASEILISMLYTENDWNRRVKAVKKLIEIEDDQHFKDIKNVYKNESYSQTKITLINLIEKEYKSKGIEFLLSTYRTEKDGSVRKEIAKAVFSKNDPISNEILKDMLNDSNLEVVNLAIDSVGKLNLKAALPLLIDKLQYGNIENYENLIDSIVKIGKNMDLESFYRHYDSGNIHIKRFVPQILGRIKDERSADFLIDCLSAKDTLIRKNSYIALASLDIANEEEIYKYLLESLNDKKLEVVKSGAKLLGILRNKKSYRPLLKLLSSKNDSLRNIVVDSLALILKDNKPYKLVFNLLGSRNLTERKAAIKLLGKLKDENALPELIKSLSSNNNEIRWFSYKAIQKICEDEVKEELLEELNSNDWEIRKWIIKILGNIQDPETINTLFNFLSDPKANVRKAAMRSLAKFQNSKIIEPAKKLLKDPSWKKRRIAVKLLKRIGTEEALNYLTNALNDEDIYVKVWSIKALKGLKQDDTVEILKDMLDNEENKVKIAIIRTLGNLKNRKALKPLSKLLLDDDWKIKKEVEKALNKIDPEWIEAI